MASESTRTEEATELLQQLIRNQCVNDGTTASGQEHLDGSRSRAEELFTQFVRVGERMDRVRRAMHAQETEQDISADQERGGSKDLHRARKELKLALLDKWDSSREEQQRIAEILKRATAEILSQ